MEYINYQKKSVIQSFDTVWKHKNSIVIKTQADYMFAILVNIQTYMVFRWNDYPSLSNNEKVEIAERKIDEILSMYQGTVQVVLDRFPRTIRNDVETELRFNQVQFNQYEELCLYCTFDYVQIKVNQDKTRWAIYVIDKLYCCVANENAAKRISHLITSDCSNIIRERWLRKKHTQ